MNTAAAAAPANRPKLAERMENREVTLEASLHPLERPTLGISSQEFRRLLESAGLRLFTVSGLSKLGATHYDGRPVPSQHFWVEPDAEFAFVAWAEAEQMATEERTHSYVPLAGAYVQFEARWTTSGRFQTRVGAWKLDQDPPWSEDDSVLEYLFFWRNLVSQLRDHANVAA